MARGKAIDIDVLLPAGTLIRLADKYIVAATGMIRLRTTPSDWRRIKEWYAEKCRTELIGQIVKEDTVEWHEKDEGRIRRPEMDNGVYEQGTNGEVD
jgi:hypothetical protein